MYKPGDYVYVEYWVRHPSHRTLEELPPNWPIMPATLVTYNTSQIQFNSPEIAEVMCHSSNQLYSGFPDVRVIGYVPKKVHYRLSFDLHEVPHSV